MKIAVPTAATAGTTIATQPTKIASTPTAISSFQLRRIPSRTSGSSAGLPISTPRTLSAPADAVNQTVDELMTPWGH